MSEGILRMPSWAIRQRSVSAPRPVLFREREPLTEVLLLGPGLELLEGPVFDLANALLRDVEQAPDLTEG